MNKSLFKSIGKISLKVLIILVGIYLFLYLILFFFHGNFYEYNGEDISTKEGTVRFVNNGIETPYLAKYDENGNILDVDFKILCTSDLHLKNDDADFTVEVLSRFIDKENPDLVVLNGDLVVDRTDNVMQEKLKAMFIAKKQYFAITLGNHDGEEYKDSKDNPREYFYNLFDCEYLVSYNDPTSIDGYGNCAINIKTGENKISQTLFFMDTQREDFTQNQIVWYENKVNEIKAQNNGEVVKSVVFAHIQLYEFKTAYKLAKEHSEESALLYGDKIEPIDGPDSSNGFFDKMLELGSTQAYIAGHDHNSDLNFNYKGIRLMFDQPLSYQSYTRRSIGTNILYFINRKCDYFNDGVNILMIRKDSSFVNVAKYAQHEGVFDGLEEYFSSANILYFGKDD